MMTDKEFTLDTMRRYGRQRALDVQSESATMTNTELVAQDDYIPDFKAAVAKANMLTRKAGQKDGFVCKSSAGRVVRLIQAYDSTIYTQEPEELPAQWGFCWSQDPAKALPFVAIATSPYNTGDCCTYEGKVWRSGQDNNVWAPGSVGVKWDEVSGSGEPTPDPEVPEPGPTDPEQGETYPEFVQPTGGHDAYKKGDRVMFKGEVWESTIDNNVWSPETYPQGWTKVAV